MRYPIRCGPIQYNGILLLLEKFKSHKSTSGLCHIVGINPQNRTEDWNGREGEREREQKSWRNCYKTFGIQMQKPSLFFIFNFHSPITADADTTAAAAAAAATATAIAIPRLHFTFWSDSFSAKTLMVHTWRLWWRRRRHRPKLERVRRLFSR